jgi:AraC-like DNA-binding protein
MIASRELEMATSILQSMDEIEAAHIATDARIFPLDRQVRWDVTRADFNGLWLLHVREFEARIRQVALQPHRAHIYWELPWHAALCPLKLRRLENDVWRTDGRTVWAAISLPSDEMAALSEIAGEDLSTPNVMQTPPILAGNRFKALHDEMLKMAEQQTPEVQRALRMQMIERLIECITVADISPSPGRRAHVQIMNNFHRYVEERGDRAVHEPEVCRAIGVPARTLRHCCQQKLGMSPRAYLTLRRLTLARRFLPEAASVADAAERYTSLTSPWPSCILISLACRSMI